MFDLAAIGAGLPVAEHIDRLPGLLERSHTLVVQAPPGTGKTTLVPPALANAVHARGDGGGGKVLVTAPRRVAVRAAARRLAQLDGSFRGGHQDGSGLGGRVGFTVRGEHHPGDAVEFVTPGVLVRRLLSDPELSGVAAVALDEVHERQLDTDLLVGMLAELATLRDDFFLTVMSATLDTKRFSDLLAAPVLDTPAVTYPLKTEYHPHPGRLEFTKDYCAHLARLATSAVARTGHSALVFVPGVREVEATLGALRATGYHREGESALRTLPLHGRLDSLEQDAALTPQEGPRIVVATSIAESSLTVPGVRAVIDAGLSRVPRRDAARQMTGLVTLTGAQSTLDQRAGRAGREGPGLVLRAFAESDYAHAAPHITPEIATSDLTQAALWLAAWGTPRGGDLPLPDKPPAAAIDDAEGVLRGLGAIDAEGAITDFGRRLIQLPLDPRLGRALLECGPQAAGTVAALADAPSGDLARATPPAREVRRLEKLARRGSTGSRAAQANADPGRAVGLAFPGRIAKRVSTGAGDDYLLASGTRAHLPEGKDMASLRGAEWLAIGEVTRTKNSGPRPGSGSGSAHPGKGRAGAVIRAAARIDEDDALDIIGIDEETTAEFTGGKLRGRLVRRAGAIELSSTPVKVTPEEAAGALAAGIAKHGLGLFTFSKKAEELKNRLDFLHAQLGDPWPEVDSVDPEYWLGPELNQMARGAAPSSIDMYPPLQRLLPWPEADELDELAPARLEVPSGSHPRVDYSTGRPVVRVKLQECFGLGASPECAGVRVQFHLLSPAGRPLAVTDDLASFWSGPYQQVRAEMRGRYPKHPWPEDPWNARATARTKKRS